MREEKNNIETDELPEQQAMSDAVQAEDEDEDNDDEYEDDDLSSAEGDGEGGNMSLMEHLNELRTRLIRCVVAIIICSCVTAFFREEIMQFITAPAGKLYFMQPAEAFFTYIKVVVFAGFLLATPVVFYQIWGFFVPAFTRKERMVLGLLVPSSVVLFYTGLAFSFFLVLPIGIQFFMGIGSEDLMPMFSVEKYLDFIITFLLPFGVSFELPLVIIILAKMGIVSSQFLQSKFRYVFFLTFVVGAILTPPDVVSQCMIALPLVGLYGVSLFVVKYIMRK